MFARRFFAARFFAPRFYPPTGDLVVVVVKPRGRFALLAPGRMMNR